MSDQDRQRAEQLEEMVAAVDTGARKVPGGMGLFLAGTALAWSLFQLWIASPLPFMVADYIPLMNNTQTRPIHLCFAVFLAFLSYPALKTSARDRIPITDWIPAIVGAGAIFYLVVNADQLAERMGLPTRPDIITAVIGLVLLLEATRRSLGLPLMVIAILFLTYIFFGQYAPDVIAWKGASIDKALTHLWITQEGVFGIGLGVSTSFIFLFVLFGALLEKSGAGLYFTQVAFALLGHLRGGPAKAAVVSSALTGLISGSSIANVVTTGTFTIPLMKRVGFSSEKAGAVEVASSTNGQLTPPIMGAAAFLMIEYTGLSYVDVITHAFLPAVISYIALVYIVHLEACKAGMRGLPSRVQSSLLAKLFSFATTLVGLIVIGAAVYYGFGWTKEVAGDATFYIAIVVVTLSYLLLVWHASRYPDLVPDDPNTGMLELPLPGPTINSGLHFLLPVAVLMWCLVVERFSPGLAAFYASVMMIVIAITHLPLKAIFRGAGEFGTHLAAGFADMLEGLIAGARNMIGIGVATAVAGIVVGAITLTGLGQVMTEFVELISGGNLMLMLIFTAVICLVLGLGLPTTANYIVVSSLMAPVIVTLSAQGGVILPLIAVHMFVFYFGILADDTPPVGLAAYAAAAISGGDPIKTGVQGFAYDIRTAILPFLFIFNTELLMIGIDGVIDFLMTVITAVIAMLLFAAATQGWFLTKSKVWESVALLLIAFTLFRPGFWLDQVSPAFDVHEATKAYDVAAQRPEGSSIRLMVQGENFDGVTVSKVVQLPLADGTDGEARFIEGTGLSLREEDGKILVDNVEFNSAAEKQGVDFDWEVTEVQTPADRMPKELFYIPGFALLLVVWVVQRRRAPSEAAA